MKLPLAAIWKKYKLVLLVAAVGVVLNIGFFLYLNKKLQNKPEQENKKQKVRLSILPESLTFFCYTGECGIS